MGFDLIHCQHLRFLVELHGGRIFIMILSNCQAKRGNNVKKGCLILSQHNIIYMIQAHFYGN